MGTSDSTRMKRQTRKTTVEECFRLPINLFTRRGMVEADGCTRGSVEWNWTGGETPIASISFDVDSTGGRPVIWLFFRVNGRESGKTAWQRIELESTPCNFGGRRWWFQCPAPFDSDDCSRRRCGKLYLPANAILFACRQCHQLSYKSRHSSCT
jgi:hypothetical protein